jgi:hypothetical protein
MTENKNTTRFVIQKHSKGGDIHWDLMIELDNTLATWRINVRPEELMRKTVAAEKIFDHELRFLTYEGPVNNGKGTVCIADSGWCKIHTNDNDRITGVFEGKYLRGQFCLKQTQDNRWELGS